MRSTRRKRLTALSAIFGLLTSASALTASQSVASAETINQTMACFSPLTSTFSTFPIPLTASGAPDPILSGGSTTFSGVATGLGITQSLVVAGIGAGVLDFVTDPALLGSIDPISSGDGVNAATNTTTARFKTTNSTVGTHNLTGSASQTFYVVYDGADPTTLQIWVETSPGSWSGSGTTGLVQVPAVPVTIPLTPDIGVTSNGAGDISVALDDATLPGNPAGAPTLAEQNAAPLRLLNNVGVSANFICWPGQSNGAIDPVTGLPGSSPGFTPAASTAIDTVTVDIPPTAPTAVDDSASVGAGQSVVVNVAGNDTDPNGDIDPTSVAIVTPPAGGTAVANGDGTVTYTNTNTALTTDTFTYTIDDADAGTATSNEATVTVGVLGDLCTAPCSLNQIIVTPVLGATMTLQQDGIDDDFIVPMISASSIAGPDGIPGTPDDTLASAAPIQLNGQPQLAVGQMYNLTVTNARGTDNPWTLSGQVTAFSDALGIDTCVASDDTTWDNHCIPGDNLGWIPSAAVSHTQVIGDVAAVSAGTPLFPPGFLLSAGPLAPTGLGSSAQTLCSAGSGTSGGTFTCGGSLGLSVPASTAAGIYQAVLTLTLA